MHATTGNGIESRRARMRSAATAPARRMLVAIDGSPSSRRAVAFVAGEAGGRRDVEVVVRHVLPPLPPVLLESPGAEQPRAEERIEANLHARQRRALAARERRAETLLASAREQLAAAGVTCVDVATVPAEPRGLAPQLIELAREERCDTIVVGRGSASWVEELVNSHLADALVREADDVSVCVVGEAGARRVRRRR